MRYFILLLMLSGVVNAKAYKCEVNGKIEYKQSPCLVGNTQAVFILQSDIDEQARRNRKYASKDIINKQFSAWNGAHIKLERMVKEGLKDPSSFDHVSTRYVDNGDNTLSVLMKYRAKNSYGAIVTEYVKFKTDIDTGRVLSRIK